MFAMQKKKILCIMVENPKIFNFHENFRGTSACEKWILKLSDYFNNRYACLLLNLSAPTCL